MARNSDHQRVLSDDQVRLALVRAAQIDNARPVGCTEAEVRVAALEAGISEGAILQALAEVGASPPENAADRGRFSLLRRVYRRAADWFSPSRSKLGLTVVGGLLGATAMIARTPGNPAIDFGAVVAIVGLIAIALSRAVRSTTVSDYVREIGALWGAFAVVWAALNAVLHGPVGMLEGVGALAVHFAAAVLLGSFVHAMVPKRHARHDDGTEASVV